jgi:K+-transporting ATPase ATPase A chain
MAMQLIALYTLSAPASVLPLTALAVVCERGRACLTTNSGPHGLTEVKHTYGSVMANGGQDFIGLSANSAFAYNRSTALP